MMLGVVYFVFLPSIVTTPLAGQVVARFGTRPTLWASFARRRSPACRCCSARSFSALLLGLALVAIGTFFAQATATGFVGRAATTDRGSASGLYLASYFLGGLVGSAVLGQVFDRLGWTACVIGIGVSLAVGGLLAVRLEIRPAAAPRRPMPHSRRPSTRCPNRHFSPGRVNHECATRNTTISTTELRCPTALPRSARRHCSPSP